MYYISPWYNRTGWLGVKHQVTYYVFIMLWMNGDYSYWERLEWLWTHVREWQEFV